ncbi:MAG: hypothetical protein K0S44_809 [Bacteroidetes bacterium]|jgi:uncharacterized protein YceH (UPF0502 family)|nr:hypothetical protein [Bacteroidota bacterium]
MEEAHHLPVLDAVEIRVLGSLIEKSKTTPDNYPMTLNSVTLACNQKSSRKPIVQYDEETVVLALNSLKKKGFIGNATGGYNRVAKYTHTFDTVYTLDSAELAILCLLFLRGPLTPGEINSNSGRLYEFESIESVFKSLEKLSLNEPPFVKQLPRRAGQKEQRFIHLFSAYEETEEIEQPEEPARKSVHELESRLEVVEKELAELKIAFEKLYKELMG